MAHAQDLIVLKNKDSIFCKVLQKNKYSISYEETKTIPYINKKEFKKKLHHNFDKQKALQLIIKKPYLKDLIITSLNDTISCNILRSTQNYISFKTNKKDKPRKLSRDLITYDESNFYTSLFKKTPDLVVYKNQDSVFTNFGDLNTAINKLDTIQNSQNDISLLQEDFINHLNENTPNSIQKNNLHPPVKYYFNFSTAGSTNSSFSIYHNNQLEPFYINIYPTRSTDLGYYLKQNMGIGLKYITYKSSNEFSDLGYCFFTFVTLKKDFNRHSFHSDIGLGFGHFKPTFNYYNSFLIKNTLSGKANFSSTLLEFGYEYSVSKKISLGIYSNFNFFNFYDITVAKTAPVYDNTYTMIHNTNNKFKNYIGLNLKLKNLFLK